MIMQDFNMPPSIIDGLGRPICKDLGMNNTINTLAYWAYIEFKK